MRKNKLCPQYAESARSSQRGDRRVERIAQAADNPAGYIHKAQQKIYCEHCPGAYYPVSDNLRIGTEYTDKVGRSKVKERTGKGGDSSTCSK